MDTGRRVAALARKAGLVVAGLLAAVAGLLAALVVLAPAAQASPLAASAPQSLTFVKPGYNQAWLEPTR